jgi:CheY-like chemotaxis protein
MLSRKHKILVVDNKKRMADVLSFVLREAEYEVETFYDARSALLRASDSPPDVLVSDISLPEMDGIALAGALLEQNPDCKVILISGSPYWKSRREPQGEGVDGFVLLPKPFSPNELLSLITSKQSSRND